MSPLEVSLLRPPYSSGDACLGGGLSANAGTCSSQPMGLGHGSVSAPQELPSLSLGLRLSSSSPAPSLQSPELGALACGPLHRRSSPTDVVLHRQLSGEPGCNDGGCPSCALVLDVNGPLETLV